jgi:hypothetical protein
MSAFAPPCVAENATIGGAIGDNQPVIDRTMLGKVLQKTAILEDRQPWIDIVQSLTMTVAGVVAHLSAMKDGELMKIPQYKIS